MLVLLLLVGKYQVKRRGYRHWHIVHTEFHEKPSISPKLMGGGG